jgi:S-ribosylhomocysteine lyase LuxS involved in autoinducer biosynthesis
VSKPASERRTEALNDAIYAATAFLCRVKALEAAEDSDVPGTNPRECGAVRRASMDLTRALAVLRRCQWHKYDGGPTP